MEIVFLTILLVVICYVSYLFIGIFTREDKLNHEILKRQAEKRSGRTQKALLMPPMLDFSHKGTKITVFSSYREGEGSLSLMKCSIMQCREYHCTIMSSSSFLPPSISNLPPRVHLEKPLLPNRFVIHSNNREMTERFLHKDVRDIYKNLPSLEKFELKSGFFMLKMSGMITDDKTADCFIESGLAMIQRLIELCTTPKK